MLLISKPVASINKIGASMGVSMWERVFILTLLIDSVSCGSSGQSHACFCRYVIIFVTFRVLENLKDAEPSFTCTHCGMFWGSECGNLLLHLFGSHAWKWGQCWWCKELGSSQYRSTASCSNFQDEAQQPAACWSWLLLRYSSKADYSHNQPF